MQAALESVCDKIIGAGFWAFIDDEPCVSSPWDQRVVCAQRKEPGRGYFGTSFWIARPHTGEWIAGSWSGRMYEGLNDESIHLFCVDWLNHHPDPKGCYDVPADLKECYALMETE